MVRFELLSGEAYHVCRTNAVNVMEHLQRLALCVLLLGVAVNGSEFADRLDLEKLLTDSAALEKLVVGYEPSLDTILFVYGTGKVVKQGHSRLGSNALVPTCTGSVSQDKLRDLIRAMIRRHFFDLPVRSYVFMTISDDEGEFWKALKLHSIVIDDGKTRTYRQFADGVYGDRKETIPPDFAAIEEILLDIDKKATGSKPCHIAPGMMLPHADSLKVAPRSSPS
jgi:hypothetical protein